MGQQLCLDRTLHKHICSIFSTPQNSNEHSKGSLTSVDSSVEIQLNRNNLNFH